MKRLLGLLFCSLFLSPCVYADQSTARETTQSFFAWYVAAGDEYREKFFEAKPYFVDDFFALMETGFGRTPEAEMWLDFDPFSSAQVSAINFVIGKSTSPNPDLETVQVIPTYDTVTGVAFSVEPPIAIECQNLDGTWKISNIIYSGTKGFNLKDYLLKQVEQADDKAG